METSVASQASQDAKQNTANFSVRLDTEPFTARSFYSLSFFLCLSHSLSLSLSLTVSYALPPFTSHFPSSLRPYRFHSYEQTAHETALIHAHASSFIWSTRRHQAHTPPPNSVNMHLSKFRTMSRTRDTKTIRFETICDCDCVCVLRCN